MIAMVGNWRSMIVPDDLRVIGVDGYKGVVFRMPEGGKYGGYTFWHTKKLLSRLFSRDWEMLYRPDFTFHLRLYEDVESESRKLVCEEEVTAEVFESAMLRARQGDPGSASPALERGDGL